VAEAAKLGLSEASPENIQIVGLTLKEAKEVFNQKRAAVQVRHKNSGVWVYSHQSGV
jgi:hypothetical protein